MKKEELREAGLKVTLPRMKVLQLFETASDHHLTAEAIHQQLVQAGEEISLATIYRVLTQFVSAGLLKKHNFEEGRAIYELNHGEHHDHLVCVKCGSVEEFMDELIEDQQEKIAKQHGYAITDHALVIYGICQTCQ